MMDSVKLIHNEELLICNKECTAEICNDQITSTGDPLVLPRLGDQYQVRIPSLITEFEHDQLQDRPIKGDDILGVDYSSQNSLPIPIMWVNYGGGNIKHEQQDYPGTTSCSKRAGPGDLICKVDSGINPKCSVTSGFPPYCSNSCSTFSQGAKPEHPNNSLEHGKELFRSTSQEDMNPYNQMYFGLRWTGEGCNPVPDLPFISWTDAEVQSFLLGLYIFGKNLVQVTKFMESRSMGEILSFYYGKFYRSDAYRRWSECRKMRSRRYIYGQRIFTGWRQQELLSRLVPVISVEVQHNLLEVIKTFSEGRVSLEEFVLNLKALVGMEVLVEAIGIGKGKHDLTGFVSDPVRANPVNPILPIGKAFSSLTNEDIIKFLTGGFRLSKARSNDIFWEAVWPRLLARGWHSEQPRGHSSVGSKNALVFLVPGINMFSRRKLVKGNHYFDSVTDVLNKVVADPRLLELEAEGAKGSDSTEDKFQWDVNTKLDQTCMFDHQRQRYLHPRLPGINSELMKFTVVDTSLIEGETQSKVRELRSLPVDAVCSYGPINQTGETYGNSSVEQPDSSDTSSNDQGGSNQGISNDKNSGNGRCNFERGMLSDLSDCLFTVSELKISADGHDINEQYHVPFSDKNPVKDIKCQYNRRVKSSQRSYIAPASKRQKSTSCDHVETGFGLDGFLKSHRSKEEDHCQLKSHDAGESNHAETGICQGKIPAGPEDSSECICGRNRAGSGAVSMAGIFLEDPQPRTFIDLNLPHFPPYFETEACRAEVTCGQGDSNPKESSLPLEERQQGDDSSTLEINNKSSKQDPTLSSRRQSTRNRPPTTKALEALACGFLSTKRKGRGTKASASSNLASRLSRHAQKSVGAPRSAPYPDTITPNITASNDGNGQEYDIHKSHASIFRRTFIQPERKETRELLGIL
ncbi:uncharacterized protein LOC120103740 [Phoenix dactylifera]|uniref:Uncharacterized protein LOC103724027 n=1 Tax=Phoenix dactylifera TaxID=42345 RepID=A0A8B7MX40_PHODC|nr:uncharacterized protein LOC103724027 [Phoenix dactylifera]XP_017702350.1 uncharacterized protein LOC120103740 [Phoenix dactylifera]XP_038980896.1 uncharacterized protein LOC120103740 [Phoenix dactylifera]